MGAPRHSRHTPTAAVSLCSVTCDTWHLAFRAPESTHANNAIISLRGVCARNHYLQPGSECYVFSGHTMHWDASLCTKVSFHWRNSNFLYSHWLGGDCSEIWTTTSGAIVLGSEVTQKYIFSESFGRLQETTFSLEPLSSREISTNLAETFLS